MDMKLEIALMPVGDVDRAKHDAAGVFHHAGTEGRATGPDPERGDYGSFGSFSDPDGNGWLLQEVKTPREVTRRVTDLVGVTSRPGGALPGMCWW